MTGSTTRDAAVDWAAADTMNPMEALMWRAEADPRLRSNGLGVELLDCVPDWGRLLDAHEWATRLIPRFRQRVIEPPLGMGVPVWRVDPNFDLQYHVRRMALPEPATFAVLWQTVEGLAMTPFDRARAPWEAVLIDGLPGGQAAYVLKLSHSITDGLGSTQLFSMVLSRQREHNPDKLQRPAPVARSQTMAGAVAEQVSRDAGAAAGALRRGAGALSGLRRPDRALRDAADYAASLRRVLAGPGTKGSPLLKERSLSQRLTALDVRFADLRAAGKAAAGSLNDAYLAALLGGFRRYHEALDVPIARMLMGVPISVRKADDPEGGNHFAGARLAAPAGVVDPRERIGAVGALIRAARDEPALDGMALLAPALSRLPGPAISLLAGGATADNDLQASNIPGLREEAFVAGARVERSYIVGPLPGCACMAVLTSHLDTCCVTLNADRAAISEPELFDRCVVQGFEEVLALHSGSEPPVLRT